MDSCSPEEDIKVAEDNPLEVAEVVEDNPSAVTADSPSVEALVASKVVVV